MVKEYFFKDTPEWPTLYERFLRPSSSTPQVDITEIRDRAWCLFVDQKPFHGEAPPHGRRQSTSTPRLPEPLPYQNASGNSVVLTSNIASTSTNSPAVGPLAMYKDRALMQMNKRVQVLKGNARLAAKRETETPAEPPARKTFLTRAQLVAMLEQARQPVKEDVSYESRVQNREAVDAGLKGREQETASGYCENCRVRYSDLSVVSWPLVTSTDRSTWDLESTKSLPWTMPISKASIICWKCLVESHTPFLAYPKFHRANIHTPRPTTAPRVRGAIDLSLRFKRKRSSMTSNCSILTTNFVDPMQLMTTLLRDGCNIGINHVNTTYPRRANT